jgi:predicted ester cyclase
MSIAQNKLLVQQYNEEMIAKCNMDWLMTHLSTQFINHSAPEGMPNGREGMEYFFTQILHASFSEIQVTVKDMVADEQQVATRKEITGIHTGELMGIPPTGKSITLCVIDILRIADGQITDHWGENNFAAVVQGLQG